MSSSHDPAHRCQQFPRASHEPDATGFYRSVSAGVPRIRHPAARHFASLAVWDRRPGTVGVRLGRSTCSRGPILVAGVAAGTDGLRSFAVSSPVVVRGESARSSAPIGFWRMACSRQAIAMTIRFLLTTWLSTRSFRSRRGSSRGLGRTSANMPGADLKNAFGQFSEEKAHLQSEPLLFLALRAKFRQAHFLEWPSELARREPTAIAEARRRIGRLDRPFAIRPVHPAPAVEGPQGTCESTRRAHYSATFPSSSPRILPTCGPTPSCSCWTAS